MDFTPLAPLEQKEFEIGSYCKHCKHMETSSLRTLKIMPRNLNEIVRSWIRLQENINVRDGKAL